MTARTTFRHVTIEGITKSKWWWYIKVRFVIGGWYEEYRLDTETTEDEISVLTQIPDFLLRHGMILHNEK